MVELTPLNGNWVVKPGTKAIIEEKDAAAYHACMLGLRLRR